MISQDYYDEESDVTDGDEGVLEYNLISTPNDFNVSTIFNFIEAGAVVIPGFQRNYVWDIKRASKLIESLIIGLPVPQLFLYEEAKNKFLVIDGQQRLMSIYYFVRKRFPIKERRVALRRIVEAEGRVPEEVFADNSYFENFNLVLPGRLPAQRNPLNGLSYDTLGDYKQQFDLRPIRNVIIKQVSPANDDSSVHEIFYRLNTGGVTLTAQEIRASLYHSAFYDMLFKINTNPQWRRFVVAEPDINLKDTEVLLRGFAMACRGDDYNQPMNRFLNVFSNDAKSFSQSQVAELEGAFKEFLGACGQLNDDAFKTLSNRFSVTVFESVFSALAGPRIRGEAQAIGPITSLQIERLKADKDFSAALQEGSTKKSNVETRLRIARERLVGRRHV